MIGWMETSVLIQISCLSSATKENRDARIARNPDRDVVDTERRQSYSFDFQAVE